MSDRGPVLANRLSVDVEGIAVIHRVLIAHVPQAWSAHSRWVRFGCLRFGPPVRFSNSRLKA